MPGSRSGKTGNRSGRTGFHSGPDGKRTSRKRPKTGDGRTLIPRDYEMSGRLSAELKPGRFIIVWAGAPHVPLMAKSANDANFSIINDIEVRSEPITYQAYRELISAEPDLDPESFSEIDEPQGVVLFVDGHLISRDENEIREYWENVPSADELREKGIDEVIYMIEDLYPGGKERKEKTIYDFREENYDPEYGRFIREIEKKLHDLTRNGIEVRVERLSMPTSLSRRGWMSRVGR